jgi:hypothetical protein
MVSVMRDLRREEDADILFIEANILSMLASDLYSGKVPDWNIWRHP